MPTFTQANLGVTGTTDVTPFWMKGRGIVQFTRVTFPFDIKVTKIGMPVGLAEGENIHGSYTPASGGFYGRYCIWNDSGTLLAQTTVVHNYKDHGFALNRPITWGNCESQPVLKAGQVYRVGWYRSTDKYSYASTKAWRVGIPASARGYYKGGSSTRADVDRGATNISAGGYQQLFDDGRRNPYYLGFFFNIEYQKANSGFKMWNGSKWIDKGILQWNGSSWIKKPVYKWTGSWEDVN